MYNSYNPYIYNPYIGYPAPQALQAQQQMQQAQAQPMQPQAQPMPQMQQVQAQPVQEPTLAYVNGIEGAKAYILPPNTTRYLFDSDSQRFYVKSTDSAGRPFMRCFSFVEETGAGQPQTQQSELQAKITAIEAKMQEYDRFIESMRNTAQNGAQVAKQ